MSQLPSQDSTEQSSGCEQGIQQSISRSDIDCGVQAISGSSNTQNQTSNHSSGNTVNVNVAVNPLREAPKVKTLTAPESHSQGCLFKLIIGGIAISIMVGGVAWFHFMNTQVPIPHDSSEKQL